MNKQINRYEIKQEQNLKCLEFEYYLSGKLVEYTALYLTSILFMKSKLILKFSFCFCLIKNQI